MPLWGSTTPRRKETAKVEAKKVEPKFTVEPKSVQCKEGETASFTVDYVGEAQVIWEVKERGKRSYVSTGNNTKELSLVAQKELEKNKYRAVLVVDDKEVDFSKVVGIELV